MAEHALVKKKPSSAAADARNLRNHILPAFQGMRVAEVSRAEVARFYHAMRATPGAADLTAWDVNRPPLTAKGKLSQ